MCTIDVYEGLSCSAFLIHPKIIVTAAHCWDSSQNYSYNCGGWKQMGDTETHTYTGRFTAHEDFSDFSHVNDVAVITLDQESDITLPIVSRDTDEIRQSRSACALGWGDTSYEEDIVAEELKIGRDVEEISEECEYGIEVICVMSKTGKTAPGDSGGPLIIERDSAELDIVFGITSGANDDLTAYYFTNLPYYLESFVSEKVRAAEETIEATLPDPKCPANPTEVSSDHIKVEIEESSITFTCESNAPGEEVSVEWSEVTRKGAEVRFDISIDDFVASTSGDSGFKLTVYEHATLHILADGKSAKWISGDSVIAKSFIIPGSGTHKARIKHTANGFEVYEDGMKSAVVDLATPSDTIATRFCTKAEDSAMTFTTSITSLRMKPLPSGTSTGDDSTEGGDSSEAGSDEQDSLTASIVVY